MIEQRELISVCRQIGSMTEAGVDILRVTRVLRAQTGNPHLLKAYDSLDHDLRMGHGLAEAMEQVPELFSPFAVSLVRQGEARNDIAGAFHRIADFLQKEDELSVVHQNDHNGGTHAAGIAPSRLPQITPSTVPSAILPVWMIDDLISRLQVAALRIFTVVAGLLLSLGAVEASVEAGFVERRWQMVVMCSVSALFIGGAGAWLRRRIEADTRREQQRRRELEEQAAKAMDAPRPVSGTSAPTVATAPTTAMNGADPHSTDSVRTYEVDFE